MTTEIDGWDDEEETIVSFAPKPRSQQAKPAADVAASYPDNHVGAAGNPSPTHGSDAASHFDLPIPGQHPAVVSPAPDPRDHWQPGHPELSENSSLPTNSHESESHPARSDTERLDGDTASDPFFVHQDSLRTPLPLPPLQAPGTHSPRSEDLHPAVNLPADAEAVPPWISHSAVNTGAAESTTESHSPEVPGFTPSVPMAAASAPGPDTTAGEAKSESKPAPIQFPFLERNQERSTDPALPFAVLGPAPETPKMIMRVPPGIPADENDEDEQEGENGAPPAGQGAQTPYRSEGRVSEPSPAPSGNSQAALPEVSAPNSVRPPVDIDPPTVMDVPIVAQHALAQLREDDKELEQEASDPNTRNLAWRPTGPGPAGLSEPSIVESGLRESEKAYSVTDPRPPTPGWQPSSQNTGAPASEAIPTFVPRAEQAGHADTPGASALLPTTAPERSAPDMDVSWPPEAAAGLPLLDTPPPMAPEVLDETEPRTESGMERTNLRLPARAAEEITDIAWIVVIKSPSARLYQMFRLNSIRMEIGRALDAPIFIDDRAVSSRHAAIRYERVEDHHQFVLYDLASTNGTFVNGALVHFTALQDDDRIRVGETELVFKKVGEPRSEAR